MPIFVPLRVYSSYSLSESTIQDSNLVHFCQAHKIPAVAFADKNNMFGAMEFSKSLAKNGVQLLLAITVDISLKAGEVAVGEIVLIAKSKHGYQNLLKIINHIHFDSKNLVCDINFLLKNLEDLIILTGGSGGLCNNLILQGKTEDAKKVLNLLQQKLKDDLYIEISRLGKNEEVSSEHDMLNLAKELSIPIVATNKAYSIEKDPETLNVLRAIKEGTNIHSIPESEKANYNNSYLKTFEEMSELFQDLPEAIENTWKIAQKCTFILEETDPITPKFADDEDSLLEIEVKKGLESRLEKYVFSKIKNKQEQELAKKEYYERLDYEVEIIKKMKFSGYFLIVADFIKYAKNNDIPVGPGRGSGAGSIIAWALGITDIDPIEFGLIFERFLNPERISMPDFDIDFCQDEREKVIEYVTSKYGKEKVAQIITFGSFQTRGALRDVGRALGMSYNEVDFIVKKVPKGTPLVPVTLQMCLSDNQEIQDLYNNNYNIRKLFDIAIKIDGLYRHISTHAAGIVISHRNLSEVIPVYNDNKSSMQTTGFSMKYVEQSGLIKFDFLGLKTLSIIKMALNLIKELDNKDIDLLNIDFYDKNIAELFANGHTLGLFQLDSRGMQNVIRQIKPDSINDIIAIISLYRPGPMEQIPSFIKRKQGEEKTEVLHPAMDKVLEETYGIMVYQEQVMNIAQKVAGYTLGKADILRRAMGKKDIIEMEKQQNQFMQGALANGIDKKIALSIFKLMEKFAGYGFNKSHATAYALISWQTAFLKRYHIVEFFTATMNFDLDNQDKLADFIEDLQNFDIEVLPVDVNKSKELFSIELKEGKKAIRYSFKAIKGIGTHFIEEIEEQRKERPYKDFYDFLSRIDFNKTNKKQIEHLVKSGAFDALGINVQEVLVNLDVIVATYVAQSEEKKAGQFGLFASVGEVENRKPIIQKLADFSLEEKLIKQREVLGLFIGSHPLDKYTKEKQEYDISFYKDLEKGKKLDTTMVGFLTKVSFSRSAGGRKFYVLSFSDPSSNFEIFVDYDNYFKHQTQCNIEEGKSYALKVVASTYNDEIRLRLQKIKHLKDAKFRKKSEKNEKSVKKQAKQAKQEIKTEKENNNSNNNNECEYIEAKISKPMAIKFLREIMEKYDKGSVSFVVTYKNQENEYVNVELSNTFNATNASIQELIKSNLIDDVKAQKKHV